MIDLAMVGLTDIGRIRSENEDSIAIEPDAGFAVLADGMGGHQAGEIASRMAVQLITRHLLGVLAQPRTAPDGAGDPESKAVTAAIALANGAIHTLARERPECAGMGSTVVVALFYDDKLCVGHVGDSRLYRHRAGGFEQLTRDHSVIQELINRGLLTPEEARRTISKNLVTRALGVEAAVEPDISVQRVWEGDVYLLCSDGLNDVVGDAEIAGMLGLLGPDLPEAARRLIALANERGGPDNVSIILARTGRRFERPAERLPSRADRG